MQNRDSINPSHYKDQCSIECIDAMRIAFGTDKVYTFSKLNAFKYLWRHTHKGGINDLEKARRYIEFAKEIAMDDQLMELMDMVERYGKAYAYTPDLDEGYME